MKDQLMLLVAGLVAAVAVWAFWHYLGAQAGIVLAAIVFVALILDNRRLRKEVERLKLGG
jgi:hypothetical protein